VWDSGPDLIWGMMLAGLQVEGFQSLKTPTQRPFKQGWKLENKLTHLKTLIT